MSFSKLDYWRLADELSVVDAAILITGNDPSDTHWVELEHERIETQTTNYDGFDASFKALKNAILSNRLQAKLAFNAREVHPFAEAPYDYANDKQIILEFDILIRASNHKTSIVSHRQLSSLLKAEELMVLKEPNWTETTVDVESLKRWLKSRGIAPPFFFPQGQPETFRDEKHKRYSAKLACAVAAWEAVRKPKANSSAKATIEEWVRANAVRFGMVGPDGVPSTQAVEQVSSVANWATSGGANPTGEIPDEIGEETSESVQNFSKIASTENDFDAEIPF